MLRFHVPTFALFGSYFIPLFTFGVTYPIAMNTPREHSPFNGKVMWVYIGDYHLSTSISHGLSRRLGCLGLSLAALVFLFVVLNKMAYMRFLLKQYNGKEYTCRENMLFWLQITGISSSIFMIFVCSFPESEGLWLHLTIAFLYFGSNMAYQFLHLQIDDMFGLSKEEPSLHLFRRCCLFLSISALAGVVTSLVVFNNMTISSGLELIMGLSMLSFYASLHSQYASIKIHPHIIAIDMAHAP